MEQSNQHKTGKIYYSMGEVSEMFDVKPSLIRFWEQKFDIIKPHKNKKGNRMFTPEDVENLKTIYHLVKEKGMTLAGAQLRMKENRNGLKRDMEIVDRLQKIKAVLLEIRQELKDDESVQPISEGAMTEEAIETTETLLVEETTEKIIETVEALEAVEIKEYRDKDRTTESTAKSATESADEDKHTVEAPPFIQQTLF